MEVAPSGVVGPMDAERGDADLTPQEDPQRKRSRVPWLLGGLGLGLIIGVAASGYLKAVRDFFKAPGWGWVAGNTLVRMSTLRRRRMY